MIDLFRRIIRHLWYCREYYGIHLVRFIKYSNKEGHCVFCGKKLAEEDKPLIYGTSCCDRCSEIAIKNLKGLGSGEWGSIKSVESN